MKSLRAPLLLFVLPAVAVAFADSRHDLLVLDRAAVLDGQLWRLWTGHWVHFSFSHAAWNLAALLGAGAWLEHARPGLLRRHVLIAAPLLAAAILAFEPGLRTYGGLSGLATGVVVLLALGEIREPGSSRFLWAGVLALVAAKIAADLGQAGPSLAHYDETGVRSSTVAHAAGAGAALLHHFGLRIGSTKSAERFNLPEGNEEELLRSLR